MMIHPMHRVVSFAIVGPHELEIGFQDAVVRRVNRGPERREVPETTIVETKN